MKQIIYAILVKHTGKDVKQIEKDADRDFFMSSTEARDYGLVDEVIESVKAK